MKKLLILLAVPCVLLTGCNSGPSAQEQKAALEGQVMQVHDEAMAKMSQTYHLRRDLRALRDTLEAQQADSVALQQLQQHLQQLSKADEAMMDWMHQYHAPDSMAHQQAMDYLRLEQEKINNVNAKMDSAISAARKTYTAYEQK
ncbi:hypothetical protein I2I11_17205 [Pontibacter sp. 172403-2]|nr:hypothetical protein [Pontibacter sp. 172403-2]